MSKLQKNMIKISYHDVHHCGQTEDKDGVKEEEEVSLVREGGPEEAAEGDAAEVGDGQGEQGEKPSN